MKVKELYEYFSDLSNFKFPHEKLRLMLDEKNHYLRIVDQSDRTVYAIVEDRHPIEAADILRAVDEIHHALTSRSFDLVEWTDNDLYFLKFYSNDLMFVAYLSHFPKISLELSIDDIVHRHVFNSESLKYRTSAELFVRVTRVLNPFWSEYYSAIAWLSKTSNSMNILKRKGYTIIEEDGQNILYNSEFGLRIKFENNEESLMLDQFEINHEYDQEMYRGTAIIEMLQVQFEEVIVEDRIRLKIPVFVKLESVLEYIEEHLEKAGYIEEL